MIRRALPVGVRTALRRIRFLVHAEVLHVVRDRATLVQIIVVPIIQLLILSKVATFEVRNTPAYIVDLDRTSASRSLVSRFAASGHFRVLGYSNSSDAANDALLRGRATLVVTIPHDFGAALVRTGQAPVQLAVNAEKGSTAGVVRSYAGQIVAAYAEELAMTRYPIALGEGRGNISPRRGVPHIETQVHGWYNATLNYQHYMVPGILVALVTMIGTLLTAQNIVREKEVGTLEQLNVTPITKGQFIAAKLLPYWTLAMFDLGVGLVVGRLVYDIPMRGSLLLLFGAAAIYAIVALGIGLWISTLVETQQQAMFVSFFVMMVYLLMSGLLTPIDSMPHWVQLLSRLNPVSYFVAISRAILVKGAGLRQIAQPLMILTAYGAAVLWLAVRQYSKRTA